MGVLMVTAVVLVIILVMGLSVYIDRRNIEKHYEWCCKHSRHVKRFNDYLSTAESDKSVVMLSVSYETISSTTDHSYVVDRSFINLPNRVKLSVVKSIIREGKRRTDNVFKLSFVTLELN